MFRRVMEVKIANFFKIMSTNKIQKPNPQVSVMLKHF